mmetsp:Transcript_31324/g.71512  ORF Transcript_31324/g.71512 Transcript_31324/m.71512 type:complete len:182 (+) Transcript_31324:121-666(+)
MHPVSLRHRRRLHAVFGTAVAIMFGLQCQRNFTIGAHGLQPWRLSCGQGRLQPSSLRALVGEDDFPTVYEPNEYLRMGPPPGEDEAVYGLRLWLEHLGLEDRLEASNEWCVEMGAAVLEEVVELRDELADALDLSDEDAKRLRGRAELALSTLQQHGALLSQSTLHGESLSGFAGRTFSES